MIFVYETLEQRIFFSAPLGANYKNHPKLSSVVSRKRNPNIHNAVIIIYENMIKGPNDVNKPNNLCADNGTEHIYTYSSLINNF